ncbi:unnamed protein product [Mytilus coruscus]|uniref:Endonuclease/exonuclease/phosphatase domain-containing protein n=1 Tax=Mytilus coruscus TaxID=42192 RepID=A0A6J8E1D9_MYTCO|nr:unnamed protein product [Mytilus coruscus]
MDIFPLQEHWLYDCQLNFLQELHNDFTGTGKAVDFNDPIQPFYMPRGYGGVAILWKKNLDKLITTLPFGNERIQCIELSGNQKLLFISIYLPCKYSDNHLNELYECIDQLHEIMEVYKVTHQIIIVGDFNENIFNEIILIEKDIYLTLSIDYILFQEKFRDCILNIEKASIISNVSDHLPILLRLKYELPCRNSDAQKQSISNNVKWNKIDKDKYKNLIEEDLAEKSNNTSFDTKYLKSAEKEATHIIQICKEKYIHQEISTEEIIKKAVSKLNTNKAADFYGFGGRVGSVNCCAPKCADDIALVSNNPLELQTLIDITVDFSKREGYLLLQPTNSVVILVDENDKEVQVKFMTETGRYGESFKWPKEDDIIWIKLDNILCIILSPPNPSGKRIKTYTISVDELKKIEDLAKTRN